MNVLVTGGTGFVGRPILRELHRASHSIHVLSPRGHTAAAYAIEEEFGGQIHHGNILDPALEYLDSDLKGTNEHIDAVIHLVGIISEIGAQTFENVHTRGTQNVVAWAQRAGVRRFLHMSALGTRPEAVARYHRTKWAAEEIVRGSGLDWTIFRPSIIYGPGDGFVNLFAKFIRRSPVVPVMGNGCSKFQPVSVEAVSAAFVKALTEQRAINQAYDLCGPETLTLNEMVDTILAVMQRRRLKLHVPLALGRIQAAGLEFIFPAVLGKAAPLNRDQLRMLQEDNTGDDRTATGLFGLNHPPIREGIARYLRPRP